MYIKRELEKYIKKPLSKSILLLGARQTGKSTLTKILNPDLYITLSDIRVRQKYESNPGLFIDEIEGLLQEKTLVPDSIIAVDEIQKVPELMDAIQYLIDEKNIIFIVTGSSARQLKNFLPGRVSAYQLDPLSSLELDLNKISIKSLLTNGSLPEIISKNEEVEKKLQDYTITFIEEEIRKEAVVRGLGTFRRFLELAAIESGNVINLSKMSQDIGVSHSTIASYYTILEECRVVERFEPFLYQETRRRLTKSQKYIIFDLGVRRVAAREVAEQTQEQLGRLFEQFIGLELRRVTRQKPSYKIKFFRDLAGPEVDWILETSNEVIPIEVKWKTTPTKSDCKHLNILLKECNKAKKGYVICQTPTPLKLSETITAINWQTFLTKIIHKI